VVRTGDKHLCGFAIEVLAVLGAAEAVGIERRLFEGDEIVEITDLGATDAYRGGYRGWTHALGDSGAKGGGGASAAL
jgi:hypothetical protein